MDPEESDAAEAVEDDDFTAEIEVIEPDHVICEPAEEQPAPEEPAEEQPVPEEPVINDTGQAEEPVINDTGQAEMSTDKDERHLVLPSSADTSSVTELPNGILEDMETVQANEEVSSSGTQPVEPVQANEEVSSNDTQPVEPTAPLEPPTRPTAPLMPLVPLPPVRVSELPMETPSGIPTEAPTELQIPTEAPTELEVQFSQEASNLEEPGAAAATRQLPSIPLEQPAAITTAITTIISHFVISPEGLTRDRIDVLQKLLGELSNCDEEAKSAVSALQQILSEIHPQHEGSQFPSPDGPLETTSSSPFQGQEHPIPSLVYDPKQRKARLKGSYYVADLVDTVQQSPGLVADSIEITLPLAGSTSSLIGDIELLTQSPSPPTRSLSPPSDLVDRCKPARGHRKSATQNMLQTSEVQTGTVDLASPYDLCLWCNKLVPFDKTKTHASGRHRAISFHEDFTCPYCEKVFNANATVIQHLRYIPLCCSKDTDYPVTCSLCLDTFVGAGVLREHYIIFHNIGISQDGSSNEKRHFWSCIYCGISEGAKTELAGHIKQYHHTISPHYCRFCGVRYTSILGLHKHLIMLHRMSLGETLYDYYSLVCDLDFGLKNTKGVVVAVCDFCDEEVGSPGEEEKHVTTVHYDGITNRFLCSFCNMTYRERSTLMKHVLNGHLLGGLGFSLIKSPPNNQSWIKMKVDCHARVNLKALTDKKAEIIEEDILATAVDTSTPDCPEPPRPDVYSKGTAPKVNPLRMTCPLCAELYTDKAHFRSHGVAKIIVHVTTLIERAGNWVTNPRSRLIRDLVGSLMVVTSEKQVRCNLCARVVTNEITFYDHFMDKHFKSLQARCTGCSLFFRSNESLSYHLINSLCSKLKSARPAVDCLKNGVVVGPVLPAKEFPSVPELAKPRLVAPGKTNLDGHPNTTIRQKRVYRKRKTFQGPPIAVLDCDPPPSMVAKGSKTGNSTTTVVRNIVKIAPSNLLSMKNQVHLSNEEAEVKDGKVPLHSRPGARRIAPASAPKMGCTLCPYTCHRIDHLEEHIQAKHFKNTHINFCTMCNSRYSRRRDLRRHYANKHALAPEVARAMTEATTPEEPWKEKTKKRRLLKGKETFESEDVVNITDNTVDESLDGSDGNDNLCVINPDILDISMVGNIDNMD